ncbi:MAG: hypothetical protein BRD23_06265 [Halobacteriales archaeon SW_9_67_25]|jgi:hypothetical protein|nr:MAG: hypothetical protein BRD23_06265 [Halobacteriales archaeon SW_9_67_25]
MSPDDTLVHALLGAVVTVVVSPFVPFAPIVGGLIAGYLQGGDRDDGLWVGTVSGAIALVPLVVIAFLLANVFVFMVSGAMGPGRMVGGFGLVAIVVGLLFAAVYTVGLSALGGWLGNYVRYDTDIGSR